ncbi:carbohydrate-binding family 9-like protein [Flavobacterium aquidurense]|uniref:Putative carbohydrate-binding protein Carbohydrate-binding module family 9 (CBM9) n=1 Tax=Flavobacterium aquidurense TaxID=362413 RepID=A0A0Q0SB96_9FLAO|nr:carbohydrate-binding family 9-like protein [Flavobacterium aquidurense]KQB42406.1 putative carbohydrate-binding protein Carbohydrate-binding module family 9 (CBM9) [Flavobacterium aquidurense]
MKISTITFVLCLMYATINYSQNIPVHKTIEKLSIDGDLSDWKTPFSGPFVIHNSGESATQNTFVSLSWNDENLYIAYRCTDSKIIGKVQKKDSQIFNTDDLIEIFIDPDGDGQNYIEIGVNAFSSNYDMVLKCISPLCGGWNTSMAFDISGLETVSKITAEGYNTEIKIPFFSLKTVKNGNFTKPKAGTKWRGNAFRIDYGNLTEYLALQHYKSLKYGFHQPEEFAVFEFME